MLARTLRWCLVATAVFILCACVIADRLPPLIVSRRAATSDDDRYWPNGNVFYTFGTRLVAAQDNSFLFTIRDAMNKWEEQTCLRFFYRTVQTDYIEFTAAEANKCACTRGYYPCCNSKFIGNKGGKQVIELGQGCNSTGVIMHLIGHTVGYWHEHTRPDRDNYIRIISHFVQNNALDKFVKRRHLEIDYQATGYDFGSIMHPPRDYFSILPGLPTIEVINTTAFREQGSPNIGQRGHLSQRDVNQTNRLYHCPRTGILGILEVYIGYAYNVTPNTTLYQADDVNPYIEVTGVDSHGRKYSVVTDVDLQTPTWNETMDLGGNNWQFFRFQILNTLNDSNSDNESALSMSQTIPVSPGNHFMLKHCIDVHCASYVYFDYSLFEDGDECSSNPCQNGGTCIDEIASYSCNCPLQYTGSHCEQKIWCTPNPCQNGGMCIEANDTFLCNCSEQYTGNTCEQRRCFPNPCQNGGMCSEEPSGFNRLHSSRCTCPQQYTGTHCERRNYCYPNPCRNGGTCINGLSSFTCRCPPKYTSNRCERRNYCYPSPCRNGGTRINGLSSFTCRCPPRYTSNRERRNYCYPSPCRNGGTCINGPRSLTCSCPSTYTGTHCEYRLGYFRLYARYGNGLQDLDGWWNESDPYLVVIAYDNRGYSVRRNTRYIAGDLSPVWNQWLYFTYKRVWTRFTVQVFDSDNNADDLLSLAQNFNIDSPGCRNDVRHNAKGSGYVIFDYCFD